MYLIAHLPSFPAAFLLGLGVHPSSTEPRAQNEPADSTPRLYILLSLRASVNSIALVTVIGQKGHVTQMDAIRLKEQVEGHKERIFSIDYHRKPPCGHEERARQRWRRRQAERDLDEAIELITPVDYLVAFTR